MFKICWHKYESWEVYKQGDLVDDRNDIIGSYVAQKRICTKCGKISLRTTTTTI